MRFCTFSPENLERDCPAIGSSVSVNFLQIQTSGGADVYRGVDLTAGTTDLGNTTVTVRAIDTDAGEYCTRLGYVSQDYAERCFTITPATQPASPDTVLVRLYGLTADELNGIATGNLAVFRNFPEGGATWVELTSSTGTSGNFSYAEASTPGFSHFLLGDAGNAPTAVSLQSISATSNTPLLSLTVTTLLLMVMGGIALRRRSQQS